MLQPAAKRRVPSVVPLSRTNLTSDAMTMLDATDSVARGHVPAVTEPTRDRWHIEPLSGQRLAKYREPMFTIQS